MPTATEQGVPLVLRFNNGLWTALGTSREVIQKLNGAVNESTKVPALQERLRNASVVAAPMTPEEMIRAYESEIQFYTEAAALIGFKPQ